MRSIGKNKPKIVVRLSHMGDVALITGVLAFWHETRGDTFIVITRKGNAPLLENHPAIVEVVSLPDEQLKTAAWFDFSRSFARRYKGHTMLDLHGTLRSRILSLLWKGPIKRYPKMGLTRRLFDRTHKDIFRNVLERTNVTQRYAMALEATPPDREQLLPQIHLTDQERTDAARRMVGLATAPIIAVHPYATHPAKQWPREHWLELLELLGQNGLEYIVVGRDEVPLLTGSEVDLTNRTDLRETCALLAETALLVTGDSGPMHLAAGMGTPVIAMFGPTVRAWGFYPAGANDTILERNPECRPCSLHGGKDCPGGFECMTSITPAQVMEKIQETLRKTNA